MEFIRNEFKLYKKYFIGTDTNPNLVLRTLKEWIDDFYYVYKQDCEEEITFKEFMLKDRSYSDLFSIWEYGEEDNHMHIYIDCDERLKLLDFMEEEIRRWYGERYYYNESSDK